MLVEIDGARILFDPVWARRASPSALAGPKRFHEPPLALDNLPPLDAILASHDHYDHLDRGVVRDLARSATQSRARFIVPLGVGAHLERWGVSPDRITELDWTESTTVGPLKVTATPARHFSGRGLNTKSRPKSACQPQRTLGGGRTNSGALSASYQREARARRCSMLPPDIFTG